MYKVVLQPPAGRVYKVGGPPQSLLNKVPGQPVYKVVGHVGKKVVLRPLTCIKKCIFDGVPPHPLRRGDAASILSLEMITTVQSSAALHVLSASCMEPGKA